MPSAPSAKSGKVNYQDHSNQQKKTGSDHAQDANMPSPRPGVGAVPKGGARQPKGQPPLNY